ncbi:MAG: hypothetical protein JXA66_00605 [Oligoflexia bacterium]|nr:hypothetical protein [Oligoflexia bacterium]
MRKLLLIILAMAGFNAHSARVPWETAESVINEATKRQNEKIVKSMLEGTGGSYIIGKNNKNVPLLKLRLIRIESAFIDYLRIDSVDGDIKNALSEQDRAEVLAVLYSEFKIELSDPGYETTLDRLNNLLYEYYCHVKMVYEKHKTGAPPHFAWFRDKFYELLANYRDDIPRQNDLLDLIRELSALEPFNTQRLFAVMTGFDLKIRLLKEDIGKMHALIEKYKNETRN